MRVLNKKGVESLPFRYIIIALVAALVVAIALNFVGILKVGTISAADELSKSTNESVICSLDKTKPVVTGYEVVCDRNTNTTFLTLNVTDGCGVNDESIGFYTDKTNNIWTSLGLVDGNKNDGTWTGSITNSAFNTASSVKVTFSIKDLAENVNQKTGFYEKTCS